MDRSQKTPLAIILALAAAIGYAIFQALAGPGSLFATPSQPLDFDTPATQQANWYAVYFTDRGLDKFRGGPDEALVTMIGQARLSVDVAAYEIELWSVRDALLAAHQRGVAVRVVVEADNWENPELQKLIEAGIPVAADWRDGLMHNKFVLVDRQGVWTGSMNFTLNGAYRNDNNLLWIASPEIAAAYLVEFEEMFVDDQFGATSPANTPQHRFTLKGVPVELYFSPDDGVARRLVALLKDAQERIVFMAFSFTSDELGEAIIARAKAGVAVTGVFDEGQAGGVGGEYERMREAGLDVYLDGNPNKLHHKVIIIDERIVITGSYNFSHSAETRNDENMVIIFSEEVAGVYLEEAGRVVEEAKGK